METKKSGSANSNAETYSFSDFTHAEYVKLLELAKASFRFETFNSSDLNGRCILWRHDVDFSVQSALELARIENAHGIKSTYYLLFHSDFYNLLESKNVALAKEILALDHDIGLHFDANFYGISDVGRLEKYLLFEQELLQGLLQSDVKSFAFHNPMPEQSQFRELSYAGMINAYAQFFVDNFEYCSDSNGYWRNKKIGDVIRSPQREKLQILTHPAWWTKTVMSPKEKILNCIEHNKERVFQSYVDLLTKNGRKVIDWD